MIQYQIFRLSQKGYGYECNLPRPEGDYELLESYEQRLEDLLLLCVPAHSVVIILTQYADNEAPDLHWSLRPRITPVSGIQLFKQGEATQFLTQSLYHELYLIQELKKAISYLSQNFFQEIENNSDKMLLKEKLDHAMIQKPSNPKSTKDRQKL